MKRWIKRRIDLMRMQRVLGIKLNRSQRKAALMNKLPIEVLRTWRRGSGKTTVAIIWMALHEKRDKIYFYSECNGQLDHGEPFFIPDPDIKTMAMFQLVFLQAKEMCEKLQEKGIQAPSLRR